MKRRLFVTLFLMALGGEVLPSIGYHPQLFDRVVQWWNAPPAPPSPEAQRLIASLENGEGWSIVRKGVIDARETTNPWLKRGNLLVSPGISTLWHPRGGTCWIEANNTNCESQFSTDDLVQINAAAERCLRRLTAQALETAEAAPPPKGMRVFYSKGYKDGN